MHIPNGIRQEAYMHVFSAAFGIALSFVAALIGGIIGMPSNVTLASAMVLGVMSTMIADRIFYISRLDEVKSQIISTLRIPESFSGYLIYKRGKDALSYINANIPRAVKIYNTRLEQANSIATTSYVKALISDQDRLISEAVAKGADFEFIYEKLRASEVSKLRDKFCDAANSPSGGGCVFYAMDAGGAPVLQMLILEYEDLTADALVGWDMGNDKAPDAGVIRFSERPVVDFFIDVFKTYARLSAAEKIE